MPDSPIGRSRQEFAYEGGGACIIRVIHIVFLSVWGQK